jgi:hypothetical protein
MTLKRRAFLQTTTAGAAATFHALRAAGAATDQGARAKSAAERGRDFLIAYQHSDGSWRSDRYGGFRRGDALTPLVLIAIGDGGPSQAVHRAWKFLAQLVEGAGEDGPVLDHPVYTASLAISALAATGREGPGGSAPWVRVLRRQQFLAEQGWTRDDPEFGGWGYAAMAPIRPGVNLIRQPNLEPNLSATAFALEALSVTARRDDPAIRAAMPFVARCQNIAGDGEPSRFDDGGFFMAPDAAQRNKAGIAGIDQAGRQRFRSYGSATADGLRALRACGADVRDRTVQAAVRWLHERFHADVQSGSTEPTFLAFAPASYFYYCYATSRALDALHVDWRISATRALDWRGDMTDHLVNCQAPDGSWSNAHDALREDEPILATAFAVATLTVCQRPYQ